MPGIQRPLFKIVYTYDDVFFLGGGVVLVEVNIQVFVYMRPNLEIKLELFFDQTGAEF